MSSEQTAATAVTEIEFDATPVPQATREQTKQYEAFVAQAKLIFPTVAIPSIRNWMIEECPTAKEHYGEWYNMDKPAADGRYHAHKREKEKDMSDEQTGAAGGELTLELDAGAKPASTGEKKSGKRSSKKAAAAETTKAPRATKALPAQFTALGTGAQALQTAVQKAQAKFDADGTNKNGSRKSDPERYAVEIPLTEAAGTPAAPRRVSLMWFASAASDMKTSEFSRKDAIALAAQLGLTVHEGEQTRSNKKEDTPAPPASTSTPAADTTAVPAPTEVTQPVAAAPAEEVAPPLTEQPAAAPVTQQPEDALPAGV